MRTVAVFNQKGGVGKTSIAFHLAWYLSAVGRRVLVIDLDPQGNLSSLFEVDGCLASEIFTRQFADSIEAREVERVAPSGRCRFSVITADERLQALEATTNGLAGLTRLRKALRTGDGRWDVTVVDCPPSLGGFSANALVAADSVVVPCTLRQFSIHGLEHVAETIQATREEGLNPDLRILGIVLNQYRKDAKRQTTFERDIVGDVEAKYGRIVVSTTIPQSIKLEEALYAKLPIWEYDIFLGKDRSAQIVADAYRGVMKELTHRLEGERDECAGQAILADADSGRGQSDESGSLVHPADQPNPDAA